MGGEDAAIRGSLIRFNSMRLGCIFLWFLSFPLLGQVIPPPENRTYDDQLRTVFLYPTTTENIRSDRTLFTPVVSLTGNQSLVLEFDDLSMEGNQFYVKLFHFDAEWKPSGLRDMEFLDGFNEFTISNYEVSQNTKTSYHHYRFLVPRTRLAGNYLLAVYPNYRMEKPLLTQRFCVLDPRLQIQASIQAAQDGVYWRTHQQAALTVQWTGYDMAYNPAQDFKVYIGQNQRKETMKGPLTPTQIIPQRQQLRYQLMQPEQLFPGGNEFRYIDLRSSFTRGFMVDRIQLGDPDELWMSPQNSRALERYVDQRDFNGQFIIENRDQTNPNIACDYINLHVVWRGEGQTDDQWFIRGAFNQWAWDQPLRWSRSDLYWTTELSLKQGVYDYIFSRIKADGTREDAPLEGNFSDTENMYEVWVYHRPPGARSDQLVGYARIPSRIR